MASLGDFKDTVALVTGAGSGMGRATAKAFAKQGSKLLLVDMSAEGLQQTAKEIGDAVLTKCITLDISNSEELIAFMRSIPTLEGFGRLDFALNCAGVLGRVRGPFLQSDQADIDWIMNINLRAQQIMTQEEIKIMLAQKRRPPLANDTPREAGCIVQWCSWVTFHASATGYAYAASKAALGSLTRSAAVSHAAEGLRINAVAPGIMNTPLMAGANQAQMDRMTNMVPAKRMGESEEVANVALFLCSDLATYINGHILNVDGAWHAM